MSDQEIRSGETDEGVRLVNDDGGERLIQMLSVIASNVDRAYPETTDGTYTQEHTSAGTTVVAVQGQHGFEQMSNLLTITVPSSVGHTTDGIPTHVIHMDQGVAMVHHEVVVGSPDLSLADDSTITIQPMADTDIALEDVHVLQPLAQKEQNLDINTRKSKKMIFMTNYREYTISDVDGRICIGEPQDILSPEAGCKMVPVTDISTGHKFEYQYKHRGTVKRYEAKDMIIYFIGQISNERIRALYYQVVFQLVCKVGTVDLDIDYTSGRKVYSDYYSCFGPSTARTIRSPIEKLTYMKLLMLGDMDEACESSKSQTAGQCFGPSNKLRNSRSFKRKKGRPKKVQDKSEVQNQPADHMEGETLNAGETVLMEVVTIQDEDGQPLDNDVSIQIITPPEFLGQPLKRKRGRPRKSRLPDGTIDRGNEETPEKMKDLPERGTSKRRVKPPSRLSDYYDFTRKNKKEGGVEEDDEEEIFSDKAFHELDEPAVKKQKLVEDLGLQARSTVVILQESQDECPNEEVNSGESTSALNLPPIDDEVHLISESLSPIKEPQEKEKEPQEKTNSEVKSKPVIRKVKKKLQPKQKPTVKFTTRILHAPQKRGPGRPRKDDVRYKHPITAEDIDELVMQKKKYPSSHFQRAGVMKKYLCQACLTNHEKPIDKDGDMTDCPILYAKRTFKDQAAAASGSGACSLMSLPSSLSVKVSPDTRKLTVCAGQDIPMFTEFGPLVGILLGEDDIQVDTDLSQVWFLQQEDEAEKYFLYTGDENASNWCHYLTPVTPPTKYNTVMVLRDEGIFFTTSQKILAGNELTVHVPFFGNKSRPVAATNQTECLHCKRSFQSGLDYQKHYHIFHPGGFVRQKQKCRVCSLSFPGFKDLNNHMILKHDGQGAFQCEECPRTFATPARLRVHKADVHPPAEAAVNCEKCGKIYRSKRALANHLTNVHSEFKFACEVCGKWFDRRSTLLRHQRLHTGKFKHFCDRCGKGFRDLHNLKVHTLTHSGIRPFSCNFCTNTSFSTRTCLKVHYERLHKMTEDMMPELTRSIPFTMEAYSGALSPVDKQPPRRQNKVIKLTAPKDHMAALQGTAAVIHEPATTADLVTCDVKLEGDDDGSAFSEVVSTAGLDANEAQVVLPGESLLRTDLASGSTVRHHYVELDSSTHQEMAGMSMVVEEVSEGTEMVETEQVSEGDHCYYALNVDGQQVLVPATEEVCVIVEDDNLMYQTTSG